jgi:hypothetical protein
MSGRVQQRRCASIQAYFTAHPSQSTPSLYWDFDVHLQPRVLRAQPRQLHLLGRDRLGTSPRQLAGLSRLHPVTQRLLDHPKLPGSHDDAHRLGVLDGLLLELGRVLLLRNFLYFSSFRSQC